MFVRGPEDLVLLLVGFDDILNCAVGAFDDLAILQWENM